MNYSMRDIPFSRHTFQCCPLKYRMNPFPAVVGVSDLLSSNEVDRLVGEVQRTALQPFPAELFLGATGFFDCGTSLQISNFQDPIIQAEAASAVEASLGGATRRVPRLSMRSRATPRQGHPFQGCWVLPSCRDPPLGEFGNCWQKRYESVVVKQRSGGPSFREMPWLSKG